MLSCNSLRPNAFAQGPYMDAVSHKVSKGNSILVISEYPIIHFASDFSIHLRATCSSISHISSPPPHAISALLAGSMNISVSSLAQFSGVLLMPTPSPALELGPGLILKPLSEYCFNESDFAKNRYVVNFGSVTEEQFKKAAQVMCKALRVK